VTLPYFLSVYQQQESFDPVCLQKEVKWRLKKLADKSQVQEIEEELNKILKFNTH
jgi:hypothetical protein